MEKDEAELQKPARKPRTGKRKIASGLNGNGRNRKLVVESDYGPCMSKLTTLQQRFVEVLIAKPYLTRPKALIEAGYDGTYDGGKQMAIRLMRNPEVLEAIQEVGKAALKGMVPTALNALHGVLADPKHRDHVKATLALMDRTGLHAVSESKQTVTHTFDREMVIAKIAAIMEKNPALNSALPALPAPQEQPIMIEAEIIEDEKI